VAEALAMVTKIFSGALSDYLGKRKLLAAMGYGLAAFTKPVFPLAPTIGWQVAARFVDRIGKGIRGAPRDALIADLSPADLRGASYGLRQSLDTIGAVLGPLAAMLLMLVLADNFTTVFWIAVIPAVASFAVILFWVSDPDRPAATGAARLRLSLSELTRMGAAYWIVVGVAGVFTLARCSEAFLLLRAQSVGVPLALVPVVLVIMNVVYAVSAWPAGALSDRLGRYNLLAGGFALLVVADLALAFANGITMLGTGVALWGLHMGLTRACWRASWRTMPPSRCAAPPSECSTSSLGLRHCWRVSSLARCGTRSVRAAPFLPARHSPRSRLWRFRQQKGAASRPPPTNPNKVAHSAAMRTSGAAARTSASTWLSYLVKFSWNMRTSLRAVSSNSALFCQVL
jgi:MFS family permease